MRTFTPAELRSIEQDARDAQLGPHFDAGHWLGLVIDLARELRRQQEVREGHVPDEINWEQARESAARRLEQIGALLATSSPNPSTLRLLARESSFLNDYIGWIGERL